VTPTLPSSVTLDVSHLDPETRRLMYLKTVAPLWRKGNLRFLLDETQLQILDRLNSTVSEKFYLLCSRRLGKSYTLVTLAFSLCIRKKNARVQYMAPQGKDAADIVNDIAATLLESCPDDVKPEYNAQSKEYKFKNGSVIRFKGVNGEHAQYLRGGASDLIILDECGIMDDLTHVVSDICMPMIMTTDGRILLATTPPRTPGHDSAVIYEQLAGQGATVKFTLLDNHRVSNDKKARFLVEAGEDAAAIPAILSGQASPRTTTAKREYFCEFVTDAALAVLPEFPREGEPLRADIVKASVKPDFADNYVAMDPGMKDRTGILYAYWDFKRGKLVVEDESLLSMPSTLVIADEIMKKEYSLWRGATPAARVSDVEKRLILDLNERHGLKFIQAKKQDSLGAINLVRNMIQTKELEINPRCKHLIRQCENAIWNNKATDFARAGEKSEDGHFDLVAALKYLCRHVNRRKNPYPADYNQRAHPEGHFPSPRQKNRAEAQRYGLIPKTAFAQRILRSKGR
jgi:hypothetical protein